MEEVAAFLLAAWTAIVGTFLPLIIQIVKKAVDGAGTWTTRAKQILALVVAAVGGLATTAGVEGWNFAAHTWQEFVAVATGVWAVSQVAYASLWKSIFSPDPAIFDPPPVRYDEGYNAGDQGFGTVSDV